MTNSVIPPYLRTVVRRSAPNAAPILTRSGALVLAAFAFNVLAPIAIARWLFGTSAWPLVLPLAVTCAALVVALVVRHGVSGPRESLADVVERRALEAGPERRRLAGVRHAEVTR